MNMLMTNPTGMLIIGFWDEFNQIDMEMSRGKEDWAEEEVEEEEGRKSIGGTSTTSATSIIGNRLWRRGEGRICRRSNRGKEGSETKEKRRAQIKQSRRRFPPPAAGSRPQCRFREIGPNYVAMATGLCLTLNLPIAHKAI